MELAVQERTLAQSLTGGNDAGWGDIPRAGAGRRHTLAPDFVHQEEVYVVVAQGIVQSVHHTLTNLSLIKASIELRAQPE
jgi:hypothetical protein